MKRIGILTAGGDTPALNATIHGAVVRANQLKVEIFTNAIGNDDADYMRQTLFDPGNLAQPYHSINTDVQKRIRFLETESA